MNKAKRIKRLMIVDENAFPNRLRESIVLSGMEKMELAEKIDRQSGQIHRYLTYQIPPLKIFRQLCVELQVDPKVLLGLSWENCDDNPEIGVIYVWNINSDFNTIRWVCPKCKRKNVTYGEWMVYSVKEIPMLDNYAEVSIKKIIEQEFVCEYDDCSECYGRLYELEDKIKDKM